MRRLATTSDGGGSGHAGKGPRGGFDVGIVIAGLGGIEDGFGDAHVRGVPGFERFQGGAAAVAGGGDFAGEDFLELPGCRWHR